VTIALAVALVIAGIAGYYLMDARPDWQRWSAAGLGLIAGLAVFAASPMGRRSWQFALDSRVELRKVVWPSRQETLQTTLAVFLFVTVAGLFFWLLDAILAWVTKLLTGQGG
jgi:preprotein translocase subunit SecE